MKEYSTATEAEAQWKEMLKIESDLIDMAKTWHEAGKSDVDLGLIFNIESGVERKWWIALREKVKTKLLELIPQQTEPEKSWVVTTMKFDNTANHSDVTSFDFKDDELAANVFLEAQMKDWTTAHEYKINSELMTYVNPVNHSGVRIEHKKWPE